MGFNRALLPEPPAYAESRGIVFRERKGTWRTTGCPSHGGSDSMRMNTISGAWVCMSCGIKGGDVLAFEMMLTGAHFRTAAERLGAWIEDGKPAPRKPTPLPARKALSVLHREALLVGIEACRVARGESVDRERLLVAAGRITKLAEAFQ